MLKKKFFWLLLIIIGLSSLFLFIQHEVFAQTATATATIIPTRITSLPQTGVAQFGIALFMVSLAIILLAFVF